MPQPAPGPGDTKGMSADRTHLALFLYGFTGGGVPRVMVALANAFAAQGQKVDFVVLRADGPHRNALSSNVRLVELTSRALRFSPIRNRRRYQERAAVPALARYLRSERPDLLLSAGARINVAALWARALARTHTPVVVSAHTHLTTHAKSRGKGHLPWLARRTYPAADAIIAVSDGVADDLSKVANLPRERITTIYNPVVTPELEHKIQAPLDHPWFAAGSPPVILSAGRLTEQKDYPTLIEAFALLRAARPARLMILGEGKLPRHRSELLKIAEDRGIAEDVDLPGFVENPYPYMARAAVFVLSSAWEGFGNVIPEALACGCPVVSTDCPSGPAEILDNGIYGPLVSVGDAGALAEAMASVLDAPPDGERLRKRAALFTPDNAARQYLQLLRRIGSPVA